MRVFWEFWPFFSPFATMKFLKLTLPYTPSAGKTARKITKYFDLLLSTKFEPYKSAQIHFRLSETLAFNKISTWIRAVVIFGEQ